VKKIETYCITFISSILQLMTRASGGVRGNMNRKLLLSAFLLIYSGLFIVSAEITNMGDALSALTSGGQSEQDNALKYFLAEEEQALVYLNNYFFPDFDLLLLNLGHEDFEERQKATKFLSAFGGNKKGEVEDLLKETRDPEIRSRCKTILKALNEKKKGNEDDLEKAMNMVLIVFIKAKSNPEISSPFLERFFKKFKELPEGHRKLLSDALKKAEVKKQLIEHVVSVMEFVLSEEDFDLVAETVRSMSPEESEELIKVGRRKFMKRLLNIEPYINSRISSNSDLEEAARKILENEKDFEQKRLPFAEKLMDEKNYNIKALGAYLIKEDPSPFKEQVLENIRKIKPNDSSLFIWAIKRFDGKEELFKDSIDVFIESECYSVLRLGLDMISDSPGPHKEKLLNLLVNPPMRNSSNLYAPFIKEHFPESIENATGRVVDTLLKKTDPDASFIITHSENLKNFDYKGSDFNDWWLKLAEDPVTFKKLNHYLFRCASELNVKPELVIPYLNDKIYLYRESTTYLLKCKDKKLRKKVIEFLISYLKRKGETTVAIELIKANSELSERVIKTLLKGQEDNDKFRFNKHGFFYNIKEISNHIAKNPEAVETVKSFLKSPKACVRFHAAVILKESGEKRNLWLPTLTALNPETVSGPMAGELAKYLLLYGLPKDKIMPFLKEIIDSEEYSGHDFKEVFCFFDERNKDYLPGFESIMKKVGKESSNSKIKEKLQYLAETILNIDHKNSIASTYLINIACSDSNSEIFWRSLRILAKFDLEPPIPEERMEKMYTAKDSLYNANWTLEYAEKSSLTAVPIIKRNIQANMLSSYSGLDDAMWVNHKLQKALTPFFVKLANSGIPKERQYAIVILSGSTEFLVPHIKELQKSWLKIKSPGTRDTFLWMLANIGIPAGSYVKIVEDNYADTKGDKKFYYYFTLARIHPDKEIRKKFTKEFLEYLKENMTKSNASQGIRMFGLIKEFPEINHPFLKEHFLNKKGWERNETGWALSRVNPFSKYADSAFREIIKRAAQGDKDELNTVLNIINAHPEYSEGYLELLEKFPVEYRFISDFQDAIRELRLRKKKKQ